MSKHPTHPSYGVILFDPVKHFCSIHTMLKKHCVRKKMTNITWHWLLRPVDLFISLHVTVFCNCMICIFAPTAGPDCPSKFPLTAENRSACRYVVMVYNLSLVRVFVESFRKMANEVLRNFVFLQICEFSIYLLNINKTWWKCFFLFVCFLYWQY